MRARATPSQARPRDPRIEEMGVGVEDPRTLQANERTLLAWLRTGVSMITFGFVISRADLWMQAVGQKSPIRGAHTIGAVFVLLGAVCEIIGVTRYMRIRRALLERRPVPVGGAEIVAVGFTAAALGLLLALYAVQ